MGRTLKPLVNKKLDKEPIFSNRFVIELAEAIHIHYRNLRLTLSLQDFKEIANGFITSLNRWNSRGRPEPKQEQHIELCRKKIAFDPHNDGIKVNWNENLYKQNKDKIYAEGTNFDEDTYCHVKLRDLRYECTMNEFNEIVDAFVEAREKLNVIRKAYK